MNRGELLYEGKAKKLFRTEDPDVVRVVYKDDATAFDGKKKGNLPGKGEMNNRISAFFFRYLAKNGVDNHFVRRLSPTEQLVRKVKILPLEVVVRNRAAGSLAKRLGLEEGTPLPRPVVEFYYKNDELGDPLINEDHIAVLRLATPDQLEEMKNIALRVNGLLMELMEGRGVILVDFKLEFGLDRDGRLLLADEISPDTCRFWDAGTEEKLDKDRFRRDLGDVVEAYREIWRRLGGETRD
ncbi:phosphoribosylaminoimidazole-succinocarboxamide synthase [Planifilum fimeticola]|jgi:phosphoribosylaminoimidazole-succinocarboxamide synthase|uniref:Phosphoribosylaminoimidazole-succinocarboxamide synthase n=1 Tax=Planifilum fimeticola TaxID=201975 RepID=A0A2T0LAU9_9BACL|nr:phosphoribosylaminoimidazolesuccinocarboxamide synthase [Planifilum fimeticola]PRX38987.1 phosphoribosylaminoimidazole-succinocarboxamide synthase [Planifilum fimeticola]